MRQRVAVNWSVSSLFGWGVYGLNLALQWTADPDIEPMSTVPINPGELAVDPIRGHALRPFLALSKALQDASPPLYTARHQLECPVLSDIDLRPGCLDYWITGQPTIGVVFVDTTHLAADITARARLVPLIVAGSEWNRRILQQHGIDHVVTVLQGVDPPCSIQAPQAIFWATAFVCSAAASSSFARRRTSFWQRFVSSPSGTPRRCWSQHGTAHGQNWPARWMCRDWSARYGSVRAAASTLRILDLGAVPNHEMPSILREMDVAVFPNRCEGGTNLVAMECMACGLPVILSRNTGHLDLIDGDNCFVLERQMPLDGYGAGLGDVPGWGESSVEEAVEIMELAFADQAGARRRGRLAGDSMTRLTWKHTAERLKGLIIGDDFRSG